MSLFAKYRRRYKYSGKHALTETRTWPQGDILAAKAGHFPEIPTTQLPAGVTLYHGTAVESSFQVPNGPTHFTTTRNLAWDYAEMESDGFDPRVLVFKTARRIPKLIAFPKVRDYEEYRNAVFWLSEKFGEDFNQIGYTRKREAIAALCKSEYNGLLIQTGDAGGSDILLCNPVKWLKPAPSVIRRKWGRY